MFEVCFSTEAAGAYFNLCEKNVVSHHTMTLGVGGLRKMSNTSWNTDCYILVLGMDPTFHLESWSLSPKEQLFVYIFKRNMILSLNKTFSIGCVF